MWKGHKRSAKEHLRARLGSMLNAFNFSVCKARFPADMVACWASMCNLAYEYQEHDDIITALRKVVRTIRNQGINIYNFQAKITGSAEVDFNFPGYAKEQRLSTSTNLTFTVGAPCFTGVADFADHLQISLDKRLKVQFNGLGINVRKILNARIESITPAENRDRISTELERIKTGYWDFKLDILGMFHSVKDIAMVNLQLRSTPELEIFCLVIVSFPDISTQLEQQYGKVKLSHAWTFVPKAKIEGRLFVAREAISTTLVLAQTVKGVTSVLGYLTGVDQMSGAYLLPTDSSGRIDMLLKVPQRTDIQISAGGGYHVDHDRKLVATLELDDKELIAY